MNYIIAIGTFQAMVATYLLWQNRAKNKADNLLLLLLLCVCTHLAIKFIIYNFVQDADVRLQMNTFIGFCYGPLIYLYTLKKKNDLFVAINKLYLFIPLILGGIAFLSVAVLLVVSDRAGHQALHIYNISTSYSLSMFNLYFFVRSFLIANTLTDTAGKERQLIKRISVFLSVVSLIGITYGFITLFIPMNQNLLVRSICYAALSIVCLIILRYKYVGVIQQNNILQQPAIHNLIQKEVAAAISKEPILERKDLLTENEQQRIWEKLQMYLSATEAYTDAELSLEKLSSAISVSRYHLSETLNSYADKSFYQYINELRISRVTEQMRSLTEKGLPINILALAYDSGFKAKSSFNQYFKKITGYTPSLYIKKLSGTLENISLSQN